jgi:hypothetical protein
LQHLYFAARQRGPQLSFGKPPGHPAKSGSEAGTIDLPLFHFLQFMRRRIAALRLESP